MPTANAPTLNIHDFGHWPIPARDAILAQVLLKMQAHSAP
jgi:hypothetical protein